MVRFDLLIILLCMVCVFLPLCISSNLSLDPRCFDFYLVGAGYFCVPIHLLLFWITKLKRFYWEIQSIWIHLMCVETHDNTLQVSDFILWVEPKHLLSKSFVHSITRFFLLPICLLVQRPSVIFSKISSFLKRGINSKC